MSDTTRLKQIHHRQVLAPILSECPELLLSIFDDPTDVLRRLVYADWLEEHDQGCRAELIRKSLQMQHLEAFTTDWNHLLNEFVQLLDVYRPCFDLVGGLPHVHLESPLAGFLEQIHFASPDALYECGPTIFRAIPTLHRLHVSIESPQSLDVMRFLDLPDLERFTEICLSRCQIKSPDLRQITTSGRFKNLRVLDLSVNQICFEGVQQLVQFAIQTPLKEVDLRSNPIPASLRLEIQHQYGEWIRV